MVYIDESAFALNMPRTYGYTKVWDKYYDTHNYHARRREDLIGALLNNFLTACITVSDNVDSDTLQ